jgi:DNA repair protein RadA
MTGDSVSGSEALKRNSEFRFYGSGSGALDRLLEGGYREGRVVEFFGRSGSGKTQIAMQAALSAARAGVRVLYVDSEGTFRPERVEGMASARGWDSAGLLDRVIYLRTDSSSEQMEAIRRMSKREATSECKLVVVDTLTRNFTVDLPGRSNLPSRQGALDVHLSEMARDAFLNARAYVLTNRVTFGATGDVGIGGRTVEQLVHASIRLNREGDRVRATNISSGESVLAGFGEAGID